MAVSSRADAVLIPRFTMVASITAFLHTTVSFDVTAFLRSRPFSFDATNRFVSNFAFVGFGFPDWYSNYDDSYSDDYPNNDGEPGYDGQYFDESSVPTQSELARRANYPSLRWRE